MSDLSKKAGMVSISLWELAEFAEQPNGWTFSFPFYARVNGLLASFNQEERPHLEWSVSTDIEHRCVDVRAGCLFAESNGQKFFYKKEQK